MKHWVVMLVLGVWISGCQKSTPSSQEEETVFHKLLILDEINREDYESEDVYHLGDPLVFMSEEQNPLLWQVILKSYDVIQDPYEESKKALVLHFNYRYFIQDFMVTNSLQSVIHPTVFFDDIALKRQSLAEAKIAYRLGNYENSPHILYEPVVNQETICKLVHLKPNTEQNCFSYYSYAGPGEYLISFEDGMGQHFNYVITVTE